MTVQVEWLGGNCPVQAEGTIDGKRFYFRAGGDRWSIAVHPTAGDLVQYRDWPETDEPWRYEEPYGDPGGFDAGWMSRDEALACITDGAARYREWMMVSGGPVTVQPVASDWKYTPTSHEIADSLLALAQDIEIGKGRVSAATPPFLREAADRVSRQAQEIKRLRAALREREKLASVALSNKEAAKVLARNNSTLIAERDRLRAALREIVGLDTMGYTPAEDMHEIAKKALGDD